jgi:hypothetical protein
MFIIKTVTPGTTQHSTTVADEEAVGRCLLELKARGHRPLVVINADSGRRLDPQNFTLTASGWVGPGPSASIGPSPARKAPVLFSGDRPGSDPNRLRV